MHVTTVLATHRVVRTKSNNVYICCFSAVVVTLRHAESDVREDNANYVCIVYTHARTQPCKIVSVLFPLFPCRQSGFSTYILSKPHIPCLLPSYMLSLS
jgi:hypothetical protein